jgi:hypothetical protein
MSNGAAAPTTIATPPVRSTARRAERAISSAARSSDSCTTGAVTAVASAPATSHIASAACIAIE